MILTASWLQHPLVAVPNTDIQDRVKASLSMYDVGHLAL